MTQAATAMRIAFQNATFARNPSRPLVTLVASALRRKVGLVSRKTMWSIQRGNR